MSKQLGSDFLSLSENMSKTCVISDFISEDVAFYQSHVMKVMECVCNKDIYTQFRVWIGSQESKTYHEKVKSTTPLFNENITAWSERVFGDQKFGMIINNIEAFSPELNKKILHVLDPVIQTTKIPSGGFDMALFVGNYGWTPIGIHKDLNGGKVIHFHFGPGPKTIYQWDDDTYNMLHGQDPETKDIEQWIKHAKAYHFKAGDLYFMNEEMWHIGYSKELSVGLTFWFNHYDRKELFKRLTFYLREKLLEGKEERLPAFSQVETDLNTCDFPISSNNPFKEQIERFFQYLYEDYKLEMLSNGGFYTPPSKRTAPDLTMDTIVQCVHPYKISYRKNTDELLDLFIRGYKTTVLNHPLLPSVIEQLNTQETFLIKDVAEPLTEEWGDDIILYIFTLLYVHEGIDVVGHTEREREDIHSKTLETQVL
jgi:hypothetical protein